MALEDRPREHRQDVYCLDPLNDNAMVLGAPKRGTTNAVMTMVTTGSLLYRPERVQFYCIAASGPQLAQLADVPQPSCARRATLRGFIVLDHFDRAPEAIGEIAGLIAGGRLTPLEALVEGFEQLPTAINMLFDGKNVGKLVVKTSR